ncbi:MAG: SPOR domain-containing protein [Bacteroidota bacterium]|nr:SPOR domain-containing protein [Bacteroidota bacterium]
MKKLILAFVIPFFYFALVAQNQNNQADSLKNKINIIRDIKVDTLVNRVIDLNKEDPKINGYRIQIFSGSSRRKANEVKAKFITTYPQVKVTLLYQRPYFKIRVGNYRNRVEAQQMYFKLIEDENFNTVILVPDKIDLPRLEKL